MKLVAFVYSSLYIFILLTWSIKLFDAIKYFLLIKWGAWPPMSVSMIPWLLWTVRFPPWCRIFYCVSLLVRVAPYTHAFLWLDRCGRPGLPSLFYPIGPPACSLPSFRLAFCRCVLLVRCVISAIAIAATRPVLPSLSRAVCCLSFSLSCVSDLISLFAPSASWRSHIYKRSIKPYGFHTFLSILAPYCCRCLRLGPLLLSLRCICQRQEGKGIHCFSHSF